LTVIYQIASIALLMGPDVFISYSRDNQQEVIRLVEYLREQGIAVWMDETDIHGATIWTKEIVEAIRVCNLFILAISQHSTGSKNVVKELALASEREKIILPIYLEQCDIPETMEYQLAGIQNIALYTLDKAKAYEFVHQTIRRLGVGQAETAPSRPGHGTGTGHMLPPKAKGNSAKWITIAAAVVVLAVAGVFLTKGNRDGQPPASPSTPQNTPSAAQPSNGSHRIALLPFEVNAAKEEDKWVGGGMDNELKTALNKIDGVTIIAGLSVNTYRGANRDVSKIKSNLNVDYILDGSITVTGGKTSLNLDFINADNLSNVWSEHIEATPDTVFDGKGQIASKLANSLDIQLGSNTSENINSKHTENTEAFRLYTQGRSLWMTRSQAGMKQSIKLYIQAVELDDNFALAFAGIADAYSMLAVYGYMNIDEAYPKARKNVLDAITRNPNLAEAYISLGWIQFDYEWKYKDSEKSYKKAISLDSKITQAHQWLGINLGTQGRLEESYESLLRGKELDPNHHVLMMNLNNTCIRLGRFEEAEQYLKKGLTINPNFYQLWMGLYNTYSRVGNKEEEITNLIKEIEGIGNKNQPIYNVLIHYYKDTDPAKSDMFYKKADELDKTTNDTRLKDRIVVKVGIDKFLELANDAFEKGRLTNDFGNMFFFYEYRDYPEFKVLVEKVRKGK
jgi:TolB-like protein/Flp pilus assembly protein TadD